MTSTLTAVRMVVWVALFAPQLIACSTPPTPRQTHYGWSSIYAPYNHGRLEPQDI